MARMNPEQKGHQRDHRKSVIPYLKHLLQSCLRAVAVPDQWQCTLHRAQRGPQLNVEASNVFKMLDGFLADIVDKCRH
jgi:hypothetical protein